MRVRLRLNARLLLCASCATVDWSSRPQGICATVIKKVCRQLGIEKWPFKGNKITLRKQGICHSRKKTDRGEPAGSEVGRSPDSPEVPGHLTAARTSGALSFHAAGGNAHQALQPGTLHLSKTQPVAFRGAGESAVFRPALGQAFERRPVRNPIRGFEDLGPARRGQPSLDVGPRQPILAGVGSGLLGGSSGISLQQNSLMDRPALDWRNFNLGGFGVGGGGGQGLGGGAFGWEARAILPGSHDARTALQNLMPASRLVTRSLSPGAEAPTELGRDIDAPRGGKFSPGSDVDSKKDLSMGLDDDDQGFDLSWLVPSDPPQSRLPFQDMRGLSDMDADMLERFRGPYHYASEN